MPAAPFASIEARSAAAVFRHLANAQAQILQLGGGVDEIPVIFEEPYAEGAVGLAGMACTQPSAIALSQAVADLAVGTAISVNGTSYVVVERRPGGTGLTALILEEGA